MKSKIFPFSALVALCLVPAMPVFAQQGTPLPPPPGMTATPTPETGTQLAPDEAPQQPTAPGDDLRACKHTKVIDGIPYTWDKLEKARTWPGKPI